MRLGFVSKEKKNSKKKPKSQTLGLNSERVVSLIMKMPLKIELWKLKTPKMCFQFPQLITQKSKNWVMETKIGNNAKQTSQS